MQPGEHRILTRCRSIDDGADRARAEKILLQCVREHTESINEVSEPVRSDVERRYGITVDDLTPRVFYRLTMSSYRTMTKKTWMTRLP